MIARGNEMHNNPVDRRNDDWLSRVTQMRQHHELMRKEMQNRHAVVNQWNRREHFRQILADRRSRMNQLRYYHQQSRDSLTDRRVATTIPIGHSAAIRSKPTRFYETKAVIETPQFGRQAESDERLIKRLREAIEMEKIRLENEEGFISDGSVKEVGNRWIYPDERYRVDEIQHQHRNEHNFDSDATSDDITTLGGSDTDDVSTMDVNDLTETEITIAAVARMDVNGEQFVDTGDDGDDEDEEKDK